MKRTRLYILTLALFLVFCGPGIARAGNCSNPTRSEGYIIYNSTYHVAEFCNGTGWVSMGGAGPSTGGGGGLTLISTQTASASASLQFTSLPTTYNTLFLNCSGLLMNTGGANLLLLVGEGATPTWETGAHYTLSLTETGNTGLAASITTTSTDVTDGQFGNVSSTFPISLNAYIENGGSSSVYKNIISKGAYYSNAGRYWFINGASYWNNDTNPITGLEIVPSSGTISSGQCSLYGMN